MGSVVTFGETMIRLSPPMHERLETAEAFEVRAAGAESNVAVAAARLGADATWISKLPDSPLGRRVVRELEAHGIQTDVAWSSRGRQGTYYLEFAGAPRGINVTYDREGAAVTTATVEDLPLHHLENTEVFHTTGITPALSETLRGTTDQLIDRAQDAGALVSFDVNYRSKLWSPETAREVLEPLLRRVDVLICGRDDAGTVLNQSGEPHSVIRSLADDFDTPLVILTLGDEGALAWHDGTVHRQRALPADTYDPIGTGDSFAGAFLALWMETGSVPTALQYAAAAAALKRTHPGDMLVSTRSEIEQVMDVAEDRISR